MTVQAQRLQDLLSRVQENRSQPREGNAGSPAPTQAAPGTARMADRDFEPETDPFLSAPPAPPSPPPAPPARAPAPHPASPPGTALATPLELAIEDEVVRASREPVRPQAAQAQGRVVADPAPIAVSRPIAQSVTKHPPTTGQTFGDLLRRSLSLRPR